ncbi:MAG: CDP-diacylglycerol--glycerol-3-phosphate 3-phosphatidyltransferase [Gemmatimonadetes bacterium]|nr:CDP-diacylglycerol--glycerol-3-phosphate 3-phosphatidyltransferase [Gemmatimonadota bacterium]NIQ53699.1 CDP-diacylglycerol--glycerol-3-phosphate 3-phosphatidyltransferase [Gemmatimonadota bacterium]NIU73869.1 CDP-diacylglycerol--glycerol-3-phosphate 3-phosphatidyltransferase [Gammaproteobacteria bacterium]NIX43953.1 CDP-diacylglycerol--glycerol-3-phosphate 3-phosphatidyltransferase [Gemmatimonadota bacterium]NIY08173.1 CDP-diacylglycerol--glycerol-3-phosphate 3-phosphatidyltransferase [Gemm
MPLLEPRTIPNVITVARIAMAPAVFFLALADGFWPRLLAFLLFAVAAFSDLWDGYLARKHGWISDFGKLVDPLADKLLVVATFIPFFMISHRPGPVGDLPYWGELPVWVLVVIFGRELLVTIVRQVAARRGRVIPAGQAGKYKAVLQNLFSGAALLWYALQVAAERRGWNGGFWELWQELVHGPVIGLSLLVAIVLTVYSMLVYFRNWRRPVERPA